jgi:hypothetical protein
LPRVSALDQLREQESAPSGASADGGGIVERLRSSRRLLVALVLGVLLLIAWISWAIYVTSDNGATAGLGVVIAWPALLVALGLISLPFVGAFLLVRRANAEEDSAAAAPADPEASGEDGAAGEEERAADTGSDRE